MKYLSSGEQIKRLRNHLGMTQGQFAKVLGISSGHSYISQLETNKVGISLSQFLEWLEKLRIESFDLIKK